MKCKEQSYISVTILTNPWPILLMLCNEYLHSNHLERNGYNSKPIRGGIKPSSYAYNNDSTFDIHPLLATYLHTFFTNLHDSSSSTGVGTIKCRLVSVRQLKRRDNQHAVRQTVSLGHLTTNAAERVSASSVERDYDDRD